MYNYGTDSTLKIFVITKNKRIWKTIENISNQEVKQQNIIILAWRQDQSQSQQGHIMVGLFTNPRDIQTETIIFTTKDMLNVAMQ